MGLKQILKGLILASVVFGVLSPTLAFSLGPYTGVVIDSPTGTPVEGASVLFYWTEALPGLMHSQSQTIAVRLVYTDNKGRYEIPGVSSNLGLLGSLQSTNVIIYQPGYQAYTVKIWHDNPYPDGSKDAPFKDKGNNVKLERIPPGFSHTKHVGLIEEALWGIDYYPDIDPNPQDQKTWEHMLQIKLKMGVEKQEFLRRLEWENRRSMEEKRAIEESLR
jgi:hypothetical protein